MFLIFLELLAFNVPFICYLTLFVHVDPLYYFFEDFILSPPMYQSAQELYLGFLVRAVFIIGAFECARSLTFTSFVFLIVVNRMGKCAHVLFSHVETSGCKEVIRLYKQFIIVYRIYKPMFQNYLSLMISTLFWLFIGLFWVFIKGIEQIPIYFYMGILFFGLTFFVVYTGALYYITELGEHCANVVEKCREESKVEYIKGGNGERK